MANHGQLGCIYEITNIINDKKYVGQSTDVTHRWQYHISHYDKQTRSRQSDLYKDMRKYGITNFTFRILESNIPKAQLTKREIFWTRKLDTIQNGYNTILGKTVHTQKISKEIAQEIQKLLTTDISMKDISEEYHIGYASISDINCGDTWFDETIHYPIRPSKYKQKKFSKQIIDEIYELLNQDKPLITIAKQYNTSIQTISKINKGIVYARKNTKYPISDKQTTKARLTQLQVSEIVHILKTTTTSYMMISKQFHTDRHTIACINQGTRYQKYLSTIGETTFPIRTTKSGI